MCFNAEFILIFKYKQCIYLSMNFLMWNLLKKNLKLNRAEFGNFFYLQRNLKTKIKY